MKTPEEAEKSWAGASWWEQNVFWPEVARRRAEAEAAKRRGGFTLIELMVVVVIIMLLSFATIPKFIDAYQERGVVNAAGLLQASLDQAKNEAIAANAPRGLRIIPDPTLLPKRLADGTLDPTQPLVARSLIPIAPPPPYSEGKVSVVNITYPVAITGGRPCLVIESSPGHWEPVAGGYAWIVNPPTNWSYNIRLGERLVIGAGSEFTVCGPMVVGNPEQFVNYGAVGATPGISRTYTSPDGANSVDAMPEILLLVNGRDDNRNGLTDEGWDGLDNNDRDGADDLLEWEQESWGLPSGVVDQPYVIKRRAVPSPNARPIDLPGGVVVDLTGWASQPQRSMTNVDPLSGAVNILVEPGGRFIYDLPYGVQSGLKMDRQTFAHFWVGSLSDMTSPVAPMPQPKEDARLITLNKNGLISVLTVNPDAPLPDQPNELPEIHYQARRGSR